MCKGSKGRENNMIDEITGYFTFKTINSIEEIQMQAPSLSQFLKFEKCERT